MTGSASIRSRTSRYCGWLGGFGAFLALAAFQGEGQAQDADRVPPAASQPPPPPPVFIPDYTRNERLRRNELDLRYKLFEQDSRLSSYKVAREFADCAERISPGKVASLLDKSLASPAERRAAHTLMRFAPGCLGQPVLLSIPLLRGAAAEAALQEIRIADPRVAREVDSKRIQQFSEAMPGSADGQEAIESFTRFTQCQVLLTPGLVRDLLQKFPASREEKALREELAAATMPCGEPVGGDEETGVVHRSYLAEALYHWTRSGEARDAS